MNRKNKGSLSLETALVLPVFIFMCITMVWTIDMMKTYARVEYALYETARELAILSYSSQYVSDVAKDFSEKYKDQEESGESDTNETEYLKYLSNPLLSESLVRIVFSEKYGVDNLNKSIKNGEFGIMFSRSDLINEDGDIDLIATYSVQSPVDVFNLGKIKLINRVKVHAQTGFKKQINGNTEYVYITKNGKVFHRDRACTYLVLSIKTVSKEEIGNFRNKDGKKYYECADCAKKGNAEGQECVYITEYGITYHTCLSCRGLNRTIHKIHISDVGGKSECPKCGIH